jgi:hypothetical protein
MGIETGSRQSAATLPVGDGQRCPGHRLHDLACRGIKGCGHGPGARGIRGDSRHQLSPGKSHRGRLRILRQRRSAVRGRQGARNAQQEFIDALFPWFEPRTAPQSADALPELLARPGVAERIEAKGVRYLVWLDGTTEKTNGGGSLSCAVGPGGGGCFGLTWWEDDASYDAAVWDLRRQSNAGSVSADVHGTSMIPALIIPVPLIARTQSAACKDMAHQLRQFIHGPEVGS